MVLDIESYHSYFNFTHHTPNNIRWKFYIASRSHDQFQLLWCNLLNVVKFLLFYLISCRYEHEPLMCEKGYLCQKEKYHIWVSDVCLSIGFYYSILEHFHLIIVEIICHMRNAQTFFNGCWTYIFTLCNLFTSGIVGSNWCYV